MADTIKIDTGALAQTVSEIQSTRQQMNSILEQANATVSRLGGSWTGNAANQFNSTFSTTNAKLMEANQVIDTYANHLNQTITEYEAAEQERQADNQSFEGGN